MKNSIRNRVLVLLTDEPRTIEEVVCALRLPRHQVTNSISSLWNTGKIRKSDEVGRQRGFGPRNVATWAAVNGASNG